MRAATERVAEGELVEAHASHSPPGSAHVRKASGQMRSLGMLYFYPVLTMLIPILALALMMHSILIVMFLIPKEKWRGAHLPP